MLDLSYPETSTALLSDCGNHRFKLGRVLSDTGDKYAFIGVNPSTADAYEDDATVRKWKGFVSRWGGASFEVANLFTKRATDVRELKNCEMPNVHMTSNMHLADVCKKADVIIPCWGAVNKIPDKFKFRVQAVSNHLFLHEKPVKCFGFTKDGDPKHPLMLAYDTQLVDFQKQEASNS